MYVCRADRLYDTQRKRKEKKCIMILTIALSFIYIFRIIYLPQREAVISIQIIRKKTSAYEHDKNVRRTNNTDSLLKKSEEIMTCFFLVFYSSIEHFIRRQRAL